MLISPKYDDFMKELFCNQKVLKHFVGDVLGIPAEKIQSICLKNTFLRKWSRKQKLGILDVVAEFHDQVKINIELQVKIVKNWDKRQLFYLARLYAEDLLMGQDYSRLKRCIGISILDFNLTERREYHSIYRLRDAQGNEFSDLLEIHVIELRKNLMGRGEVDDWIRFFNVRTEEDLEMIRTKNPGILEAIQVLRRMSMNNPLRQRYEAHLMEMRDQKAREEYVWDQGLEKGRMEERIENILYLLEEQGEIPEEWKNRIRSEKDPRQLQKWFQAAVKSQSFEEFQEKAGPFQAP